MAQIKEEVYIVLQLIKFVILQYIFQKIIFNLLIKNDII